MPRSGGASERSVEAAFTGINHFLLASHLDHLLMHLINEFCAPVSEAVPNRASRCDSLSEKFTLVSRLGIAAPLGRRGDPIENLEERDGKHQFGAIGLRSGASKSSVKGLQIDTFDRLRDRLHMIEVPDLLAEFLKLG